jgi:hypothetical protein
MAINTRALSRSLSNATTSYKFLFLLGLLELIKTSSFEKKVFTFKDLGSMMLAKAWYPKAYFRLSFGKQDQIGKLVDTLDFPIKLISIEKLFAGIKESNSIDHVALLRYVPQRILREFYTLELKGLKDQEVDAAIIKLSCETFFSSSPPVYKIDIKDLKIEISNDWMSFIKDNFIFLQGWILGAWGDFLQKNNPNAPAILSKTTTPALRESLTKQRNFWSSVISSTSIKCIYTNELIDVSNFHLDHFLPWSFVAHNQLWNLIPTSPKINIAKNDLIPDISYILPASLLHHAALLTYYKAESIESWRNHANQYLSGLNIGKYEELLKEDFLTRHYIQTYNPLIEIAINSGFSGTWKV